MITRTVWPRQSQPNSTNEPSSSQDKSKKEFICLIDGGSWSDLVLLRNRTFEICRTRRPDTIFRGVVSTSACENSSALWAGVWRLLVLAMINFRRAPR